MYQNTGKIYFCKVLIARNLIHKFGIKIILQFTFEFLIERKYVVIHMNNKKI